MRHPLLAATVLLNAEKAARTCVSALIIATLWFVSQSIPVCAWSPRGGAWIVVSAICSPTPTSLYVSLALLSEGVARSGYKLLPKSPRAKSFCEHHTTHKKGIIRPFFEC